MKEMCMNFPYHPSTCLESESQYIEIFSDIIIVNKEREYKKIYMKKK